MPHRGTKRIKRAKANRKQRHRNSAAKRTRAASSRARAEVKYRGPKISRTRLQNMREDLRGTKKAVTEVIEKFWIIPEGEIRETLAQTEKKIDRTVKVLEHAALTEQLAKSSRTPKSRVPTGLFLSSHTQNSGHHPREIIGA